MCRSFRNLTKPFVFQIIVILLSSYGWIGCKSSTQELDVLKTELSIAKQERSRLLDDQKQHLEKLAIEIETRSQFQTQLKQCQSILSIPAQNHSRERLAFIKQTCHCPEKETSPKKESQVEIMQKNPASPLLGALFQAEQELAKNQEHAESIRKHLDNITKTLEKTDKIKGKHQRILTRQEHELLKLDPGAVGYEKHQKKYEEVSKLFRQVSDEHTDAIQQYVQARKSEEDEWKKYNLSVKKVRTLIQSLHSFEKMN